MVTRPNRFVPRTLPPHPPLTRYYPDASERRRFVDRIFDSTAADYDWINHAMSIGRGIGYRREALERAGVQEGMRVLDVCSGSAQVARAAVDVVGPGGWIVCLDASVGMLYEASQFMSSPLVQGYVESIPFADESFDAITMGYALRHVSDMEATFREYHRVLRPKGKLLVVEFTRPRSPIAYRLARFYLGCVVPALARLRSREAKTLMAYFWDTIENCVAPETILQALENSGFDSPTRHGQIELFSEYTATRG